MAWTCHFIVRRNGKRVPCGRKSVPGVNYCDIPEHRNAAKDDTAVKPKRKSKQRYRKDERGCEFCPLNKVHGINKIFGKVRGKRIFIFAQSPGKQENEAGRELIGPAGQLLWRELKRVGITRDMCDIQNVVRCLPAERESGGYLQMRNPSPLELHCCSIYTEQALEKAKPRLFLIFGKIAHEAVLGKIPKGRRLFWSPKLHARVMLLDHPAFFLRGGSEQRLDEFRRQLDLAARLIKVKRGKYAYLKEQRYVGIENVRQAKKAYRTICNYARRGARVACDLESGIVGTAEVGGTKVALCCGFSPRQGVAFVFPLHKIDPRLDETVLKKCRRFVRKILVDSRVKKIFHHGSSDVVETRELLHCEVRGYDFDTNYSEYLAFPDERAYGITAIADKRFPEFNAYKEIILPETLTDKFIEKHSQLFAERDDGALTIKNTEALLKVTRKVPYALNYAQLPWNKLVLYNGADCDLTKRIEVSTRDKVSLPLLHLYQQAAFVLDKMEREGPLFDYKHCAQVAKIFPVRMERLRRKLCQIAENKEFNPGSPPQVKRLLYEKLKLRPITKYNKPVYDTQKDTLAELALQHEAPKAVGNYRKYAKANSTYVEGFRKCADVNEGRLRTIWWATGTRTGRLSSGGGREKESGVVNLQNVHGDSLLQNLLVSDLEWRKLYNYWKINGDFDDTSWQQFGDMYVFLGFDQAQFELRVLAERSQDAALIQVFSSGKDPHEQVGHELTGLSKQKIHEDERVRRAVKGIQFGIVFGLQGPNLARYLWTQFGVKISPEKAERYRTRYFEKYRAVEAMQKRDVKQAEANGYVETMLGMRRPLVVTENNDAGAYWANQALNTPVQGTAGNLMLAGMVPIVREPVKYKLLQHPQLQIHDAMWFRSRLKHLWRAMGLGIEMLEKEPLRIAKNEFGIDWKTPLKVEAKMGFRFGVTIKDIAPAEREDEFSDVATGKPLSMAQLLSRWCAKNQKSQLKLRDELRSVQKQQFV